MARDIDGIIKQKFAESGDVGLGGLTLDELWPISYSTPGGPFPQRIQFNQLFRYISALAVEINEKGTFLEWDGTPVVAPDYQAGAIVTGSDGSIYYATAPNGPASTIIDPTTDVSGTWILLASSLFGAGTAGALIGRDASGNILDIGPGSEGQVPVSQGPGLPFQMQTLTMQIGTAIGVAGSTSIDILSLPPGIRELTLNFGQVTVSGSGPLMQLGTSAGFITSGYSGSGERSTTSANYSNGFGIHTIGVGYDLSGAFTFRLLNPASNLWTCFGGLGVSNTAINFYTAGVVALPGMLDRFRLTTVTGVPSYTLGEINYSYKS